MELREKISIHLDQIKLLRGVEYAVLVQRDGTPIQSTGVWLSPDEIFNISSTTSAIFNLGFHLHPNDLNYVSIEGKRGKILIAPLQQQGTFDHKHEFFITITTQPNANTANIYLQTIECLKRVTTTLLTSEESFKPKLVPFEDDKEVSRIKSIMDLMSRVFTFSSYSMSLTEPLSSEFRKVLNYFLVALPNLKYAYIADDGGFVISKVVNQFEENFDNTSVLTYYLFQSAKVRSWLLKKMDIKSVLLDCENTHHFIYDFGKAIFSAEFEKVPLKLGMVSLMLSQFSTRISNLIKQTKEAQAHLSFDNVKLLGNLTFK